MSNHKVGDLVMWFDRTLAREQRKYDVGFIKRIENDKKYGDEPCYVVEWITEYDAIAGDEYTYSQMSVDAFKEDLATYQYEQRTQNR